MKVNQLAYTKMMLHASTYPYCSVDGLLLGTDEEICDAIPLFHNGTLAPMVEAACAVAEKYAATKSWRIVGYYFGNDVKDEVPARATAIASTLGMLVQIVGSRLEDPDDHALLVEGDVEVEGRNTFITALDDRIPIVDFDLHLQDVANDWRNLHVDRWLATVR